MRFFKSMAPFVLLSLMAGASGAAFAETPKAAKAEDVGISSQRLQRIHDLIQHSIDADNFSGAVTLVARSGKIAHFEAHGLMDVDTKKPMAKDAMFRIMSMTKPVVGVAVLMMAEEGKVRLNDPISDSFRNSRIRRLACCSRISPRQRPGNGVPPQVLHRAVRTGDYGQGSPYPHLRPVSGPMSNSESAK